MTNPTIEAIVDRVLEEAKRFAHENSGDPGMSHTFGYFTDHPVARLNRERLSLTLTEIAERAPGGARLLDMGCGGGLFTAAFAASGFRTAGVDLAPEEIARAHRFAEKMKVEPALFEGDLQAADWMPKVEEALGGRPEVVFYGYCLHHLPDVPDHLRSLGEWLPGGSIVVVNEENPRSPTWFLKNALRSVIQRDTKEEHQLSHKKWSALFAAAGFEPVGKVRGVDMLPGVPIGARWSQVYSYRKT
ncbi:MAG: methyltransferase domain-containing protein [Actinobacteria bacterium]|nr:methyltransferase domain-containing protein [Actinomycetota bacterium]